MGAGGARCGGARGWRRGARDARGAASPWVTQHVYLSTTDGTWHDGANATLILEGAVHENITAGHVDVQIYELNVAVRAARAGGGAPERGGSRVRAAADVRVPRGLHVLPMPRIP